MRTLCRSWGKKADDLSMFLSMNPFQDYRICITVSHRLRGGGEGEERWCGGMSFV